MDDLVQFLRARLDEDERIAQAAAQAERADAWTTLPDSYGGVLDDTRSRSLAVGYGDIMAPETAEHIARHDPARVLREIDAKRQILRALESAKVALRNTEPGTESHELMTGSTNSLRAAVRMLATAYADRPGYREEWRP